MAGEAWLRNVPGATRPSRHPSADPPGGDRAARPASAVEHRHADRLGRRRGGGRETRDDVVVAPALPYGSSGEHSGFPGTLSLGQAALEAALVELVRSAAAFRDVTLLSWHGGNAEPVARAVARLRAEGRRVHLWEPHVDGGDAHAGRVETSLMLALAPELVRDERPVGATQPIDELLPRLRERRGRGRFAERCPG